MKPIFSHTYTNYSYEFFLDANLPDKDLVTCVFCVLTDESSKIWLTKNHRGWELPGGHIEVWEDFESALKREMQEEIGVEADDFILKGYKKITNFEKTKNREGGFYPFPHSYILYFIGKSVSKKVVPFPYEHDETEASDIFSLEEAYKIIDNPNNIEILKAILEK